VAGTRRSGHWVAARKPTLVETGNTTYWVSISKTPNIWGVAMEVIMAKGEQTSEKAGKAASKVLRDDRTGKNSKTAAGSALTQRPGKKYD